MDITNEMFRRITPTFIRELARDQNIADWGIKPVNELLSEIGITRVDDNNYSIEIKTEKMVVGNALSFTNFDVADIFRMAMVNDIPKITGYSALQLLTKTSIDKRKKLTARLKKLIEKRKQILLNFGVEEKDGDAPFELDIDADINRAKGILDDDVFRIVDSDTLINVDEYAFEYHPYVEEKSSKTITTPKNTFDIIPDDVFRDIGENHRIPDMNVNDLIDEIGYKTTNNGDEVIKIKTEYVLSGPTLDVLYLFEADNPNKFVLDSTSKIENMILRDVTNAVIENESPKKYYSYELEDNMNNMRFLFFMKKKDYVQNDGWLSFPVESEALNLLYGSKKKLPLRRIEVEEKKDDAGDKPTKQELEGKFKEGLVDIAKKMRNKKCDKFKRLHKMKKEELINLIINAS